MVFGVKLRRFLAVVLRVQVVAARGVGVLGAVRVLARVVVLGSVAVVLRRHLVMLGRFGVMR